VGNVKLKGSLGCCDREMEEFQLLRSARRVHSILITLDFRRAESGLSRYLLGRVSWDKALEGFSLTTQVTDGKGRDWENAELPTVGEDQV